MGSLEGYASDAKGTQKCLTDLAGVFVCMLRAKTDCDILYQEGTGQIGKYSWVFYLPL